MTVPEWTAILSFSLKETKLISYIFQIFQTLGYHKDIIIKEVLIDENFEPQNQRIFKFSGSFVNLWNDACLA